MIFEALLFLYILQWKIHFISLIINIKELRDGQEEWGLPQPGTLNLIDP